VNVDVIIVSYQSARDLPAAVRSLPTGTRVIVVDNASTDGSADVARALGCEVVRNTSNAGFGRAVNRVVRELVRAETMLLLNPDACIDAANLARLLAALDDPLVAVAGPRLQDDDGDDQRPWWPFPSPAGAWREAFGLHMLRRDRYDRSADVPFVVGACLAVRTSAFRDVGGFDERYWLYGEEADLCRRLAHHGWRVRYVADALASHTGGVSGEGIATLVGEHFGRGSDRFVLTHHGPLSLVVYRVGNLIGTALRVPFLRRSDPRRDTRVFVMRRLLRSLVRHPTSVSAPDVSVAQPSLIVLSLEPWDEVWRRNQFFIRELVEREPALRVLYVEPAPDVLFELLVRRRLPMKQLRSRARLRPTPGLPQVIRFRPVKVFPRFLGRWSDDSLGRQIVRAASRAELHDPTVWINDVDLAPTVTRDDWPVLYDVTDDWLLASVPRRVRRKRASKERMLLARADEVVVCSSDLLRTKGHDRVLSFIPNAVDVGLFTTPQDRPLDLPVAPVAVYAGTLHEDRIDVPLIVELAASLPWVSFAFIGPAYLSREAVEQLRGFANVHLLGARPYEEVPAYLQHATILIVPHLVTPFTESLDPIKAYECLAVGRPTLATPVAGFRGLGPPVQVADRETFTARVREIVASDHATVTRHDVPTWSQRAQAFGEVLDRARTGRRAAEATK
jgi:teichuronic acid biosynthesis glycosyltransferase TuaH